MSAKQKALRAQELSTYGQKQAVSLPALPFVLEV